MIRVRPATICWPLLNWLPGGKTFKHTCDLLRSALTWQENQYDRVKTQLSFMLLHNVSKNTMSRQSNFSLREQEENGDFVGFLLRPTISSLYAFVQGLFWPDRKQITWGELWDAGIHPTRRCVLIRVGACVLLRRVTSLVFCPHAGKCGFCSRPKHTHQIPHPHLIRIILREIYIIWYMRKQFFVMVK